MLLVVEVLPTGPHEARTALALELVLLSSLRTVLICVCYCLLCCYVVTSLNTVRTLVIITIGHYSYYGSYQYC